MRKRSTNASERALCCSATAQKSVSSIEARSLHLGLVAMHWSGQTKDEARIPGETSIQLVNPVARPRVLRGPFATTQCLNAPNSHRVPGRCIAITHPIDAADHSFDMSFGPTKHDRRRPIVFRSERRKHHTTYTGFRSTLINRAAGKSQCHPWLLIGLSHT